MDLNETFANASKTNQTYVFTSDRPETYIIPVVFAVIFVAGVLGNGTLILIFVRHRNMRSGPNTYILSLAVGDLLVILISVPFTSTVYTLDSWPFGSLVCKLCEVAKEISIGVSVFTLTALSADRFFAIVDPLHRLGGANVRGGVAGGSSSVSGTRGAMLVGVGIWVLAVLCSCPTVLYTHVMTVVVNPEVSLQLCYPYPNESFAKVAVVAKFMVYYLVPLLIISIFYVLMARHLLHSTKNMPQHCSQVRQVRARRKVARMVLAFVAVFALCFFPQHMFFLWFYFTPDAQEKFNAFWHAFRVVGFCLGFANSCVNPVALYCVSGAFRKHYRRYLFCRRHGSCGPGGGGTGDGQRGGSSRRTVTSSGRRMQHLGTLSTSGSSRRDRYCTRSWDSTTLAHFGSVRQPSHTVEDVTVVTTFMNGGVDLGKV